MAAQDRFFFDRYGLTEDGLGKYLAAALSEGGDCADLYFEYTTASSILVDESLVKQATEGISTGCGVRVMAGDQTGYAYTDDLTPEKILKAARIAARIASGPARVSTVGLSAVESPHNFYAVATPSTDRELAEKLELVRRADSSARACDPRIRQVRVTYGDQVRHVLMADSDGRVVTDLQPLVRLSIFTIAEENGRRQSGSSGGGGRVGLEFFQGEKSPERFAVEAPGEREEFDFRVERGKRRARGLHFLRADRVGAVEHLALEVGEIHLVGVGDGEAPDAAGGEIERRGAAQAASTDDQRARGA